MENTTTEQLKGKVKYTHQVCTVQMKKQDREADERDKYEEQSAQIKLVCTSNCYNCRGMSYHDDSSHVGGKLH